MPSTKSPNRVTVPKTSMKTFEQIVAQATILFQKSKETPTQKKKKKTLQRGKTKSKTAIKSKPSTKTKTKTKTKRTSKQLKTKPTNEDVIRDRRLEASAKAYVRAMNKGKATTTTTKPKPKRRAKTPVSSSTTNKRRKPNPPVAVAAADNNISSSSSSATEPKVYQPSTAIGVIDRVANIQGRIVNVDNDPCDVMLVRVDPNKCLDDFYILQLIDRSEEETTTTENKNDNDDDEGANRYVVYSRYGRTGTKGFVSQEQFANESIAIQRFQTQFRLQTGLQWCQRSQESSSSSDPNNNGTNFNSANYRLIQQNLQAKQHGYGGAKWQYWVDDGVDGKTDAWYDYTTDGSAQVEQLYQEFLMNGPNGRLASRVVDSGHFAYSVDLAGMTQTNVRHPARKTRRIRRCPVEGVVY